jgi:hypothetical protein
VAEIEKSARFNPARASYWVNPERADCSGVTPN